jgi:hypothetical protein
VGVKYSDFPINLSFAHRKELGAMFDEATSSISAHVHNNPATPFDDPERGYVEDGVLVANKYLNNSTEQILPRHSVKSSSSRKSVGLVNLNSRLPDDITIPDTFGPNAFDDAEESIKYMVLTNTWPKFVTAGYASNLEQKTLLGQLQDKLAAWIAHVGNVRDSRSTCELSHLRKAFRSQAFFFPASKIAMCTICSGLRSEELWVQCYNWMARTTFAAFDVDSLYSSLLA